MERPLSKNRVYPGVVRDAVGASVARCKDIVLGYISCLDMDEVEMETLHSLRNLSPQMREAIDALFQEKVISRIRLGGKECVGFAESVFMCCVQGFAQAPTITEYMRQHMVGAPGTRRGALRVVCLMCGREIPGKPLATGEAVPILTYRNERAAGTGFAHKACADGAMACDLTGKPDYSGYNEDTAEPAYSDGRPAMPALPTAFDGNPKL